MGGLSQNPIVEHLVCLGTNGASTFQGVRFEIIVLMRIEQAPYLIEIHCMSCKANLVMNFFFSILMVSKLKILFQSLCGYSSSSPKCHLEFQKLAKIMEIKRFNCFFGM
jgi:hypothetical protein